MAHHYGKPLTVAVKNGKLVIEIGIHTLAHALAFSNWANPYNHRRGDYIRTFAIADAEQFAKDVKHAMLDERENGSTPLSDFFDKASQDAVEDGSQGLHEDEHVIKYGEFSPVETWAVARQDATETEPR